MENDRPSHGFVAGDGEVRGWEIWKDQGGGDFELQLAIGAMLHEIRFRTRLSAESHQSITNVPVGLTTIFRD